MSRLKGVDTVEAFKEKINQVVRRVIEMVERTIKGLESIRSQNMERYYIPEDLVSLTLSKIKKAEGRVTKV